MTPLVKNLDPPRGLTITGTTVLSVNATITRALNVTITRAPNRPVRELSFMLADIGDNIWEACYVPDTWALLLEGGTRDTAS